MIFVVTGYVVLDQLKLAERNREGVLLERVLLQIDQELVAASWVEDGYLRTFMIPSTILGTPYTVAIEGGRLAVTGPHETYDKLTVPLEGSIQLGANTIRKEQGVLCLNMVSCP